MVESSSIPRAFRNLPQWQSRSSLLRSTMTTFAPPPLLRTRPLLPTLTPPSTMTKTTWLIALPNDSDSPLTNRPRHRSWYLASSLPPRHNGWGRYGLSTADLPHGQHHPSVLFVVCLSHSANPPLSLIEVTAHTPPSTPRPPLLPPSPGSLPAPTNSSLRPPYAPVTPRRSVTLSSAASSRSKSRDGKWRSLRLSSPSCLSRP